MSNVKCYVIMKTTWAWNDDSYYIEGEQTGYVVEAYSSLSQVQKVKEQLEYEYWRDTIHNFEDTGDIWVYLSNVRNKQDFIEKEINKKYNYQDLSEEGYLYFKKLLKEELENDFKNIVSKTPEEHWRIFLNDWYIDYKLNSHLKELDLIFVEEKICNILKNEGFEVNENISEEGLQRFRELCHQHYTQLPEFYYIQEAELVED